MNAVVHYFLNRLALALAGFCLATPVWPAGTIADFVDVSEAAPKLELPDLAGGRVALGTANGQLVMVHFFATWCEPCREELPALQQLVSKNSSSIRLLVISVAEPGDRVRRFTQQLHVTLPVLLDEDRAVAKAWKVSVLPTTFVLDETLKNRIVAETDVAWDKIDLDDIRKLLIQSSIGAKKWLQPHAREWEMNFHRREILKGGAALTAAAALPGSAFAQVFTPRPSGWRNFEIITRITIMDPKASAQAWVPVPAVNESKWFKSLGSTWTSSGAAALVRDARSGAEMIRVQWNARTAQTAEVVSRISTQDRATEFSANGQAETLSAEDRARYLAGTELIPVTGIVKETADKITAGAKDEVGKARAIYEWIVENTFRDAKVRGCGVGDIAAMLKSGNLGGKCADLNALFVGLARASGLPARDIYGIRVAPSKFGYKSLGVGSEVITKAQHCRSEVYLSGLGWVPMDPADVRKVVLEEPPTNLPIDDPKVVAARKTLFGAWEGNWLAYNFAHDVTLPGASGPMLGFLMYPQAEVGGAWLDCLDPDNLRYTITAKELTAA